MKIYCAGGMKSGWAKKVTEILPHCTVFDPASHGLTDERDYTAWDLARVAESDVVLAFMESDNPSGIGMALEVGYAKALKKQILFVDNGVPRHRFGMVRVCADRVFTNLFDALLCIDPALPFRGDMGR